MADFKSLASTASGSLITLEVTSSLEPVKNLLFLPPPFSSAGNLAANRTLIAFVLACYSLCLCIKKAKTFEKRQTCHIQNAS